MNELAAQMRTAGSRVYNLTVGEPKIPLSDVMRDATRFAVEKDQGYTPAAGISALRESAANWINAHQGTDFLQDECFVTNGGKYALYALAQIFLNPGDDAMIIAPYWVSYPAMVRLAGANPVIVETHYDEEWKVTPALLSAAKTRNTKMLFFNNAANPTGVLYSSEEVAAIVGWCETNGILLVSDEVYSTVTYDGLKLVSAATFANKKHTMIVQSMSKAFGMTGWRVGFVFADVQVVNVLTRMQSQSTSNTAAIAQYVADYMFRNGQAYSEEIRDELRQRRNVMLSLCEEVFGVRPRTPKSGLYLFVPLKLFGCTHGDSMRFCKEMLEQKHVAMVPGVAFGAEGFVRLSFGIQEEDIQGAFAQLNT